jgi:hypothetical protein
MPGHLTKRWGEGIANPSDNDLVAALEELKEKDPEHPDCWVSDDAGWSIAAHEGGLVTFENVETGEGPWHMRGVSPSAVHQYWRTLISGDIAALHKLPWEPGYQ